MHFNLLLTATGICGAHDAPFYQLQDRFYLLGPSVYLDVQLLVRAVVVQDQGIVARSYEAALLYEVGLEGPKSRLDVSLLLIQMKFI